jgi:hypothetical protein
LLMVGGVIFYVEGGKLIQPETKKPLANGAVSDQGSI